MKKISEQREVVNCYSELLDWAVEARGYLRIELDRRNKDLEIPACHSIDSIKYVMAMELKAFIEEFPE